MAFPRFPDWTIYGAVVAALVVVSFAGRENADAPLIPTPSAEALDEVLGPETPFGQTDTIDASDTGFQPTSGTAFSIADSGRWVTAKHVVKGCRRSALLIGDGRAVAASVRLAMRADIAILITDGGAPALASDPATVRRGERGFHPGFPQGRSGEVSSLLLGRETLNPRKRGHVADPVLAWAEVGRTEGLRGTLAGLSGAPVLDGDGRVVGVTVAESPRRGRIYTTSPETLARAVRGMTDPGEAVLDEPLTIDNYGRAANDLRRDLRVAQVVCLSR